MNLYKTLTIVPLVLVMSGLAWADELFTPPLPALTNNFLECYAVNVTNFSRDVYVQVFDSTGHEVANTTLTLAAAAGSGISIPATDAGYYCKFTLQGPAKQIRASIAVLQPGVGLISSLPAE